MRTHIECVPCFFRQAVEASRMAGADSVVQKRIIDDVAGALRGFDLSSSPPEMGRVIHKAVRDHTGVRDPYAGIKRKSNELAMALYGTFKKRTRDASDSLLMAVELAIAGNIIDYGVKNDLNIEVELERILEKENDIVSRGSNDLFDYDGFQNALGAAENVLYLGDNAGETVFDRILIEEICRKGVSVDYAVKEKPVINDALAEDAAACGLDGTAKIFSSGCDIPGTLLSACSDEFLEKFRAADMVISKGQGNFETLTPPSRSMFFLFMAKCPVVVKEIGCSPGDILLLRKEGGAG